MSRAPLADSSLFREIRRGMFSRIAVRQGQGDFDVDRFETDGQNADDYEQRDCPYRAVRRVFDGRFD
jgi:hypothetical protein